MTFRMKSYRNWFLLFLSYFVSANLIIIGNHKLCTSYQIYLISDFLIYIYACEEFTFKVMLAMHIMIAVLFCLIAPETKEKKREVKESIITTIFFAIITPIVDTLNEPLYSEEYKERRKKEIAEEVYGLGTNMYGYKTQYLN